MANKDKSPVKWALIIVGVIFLALFTLNFMICFLTPTFDCSSSKALEDSYTAILENMTETEKAEFVEAVNLIVEACKEHQQDIAKIIDGLSAEEVMTLVLPYKEAKYLVDEAEKKVDEAVTVFNKAKDANEEEISFLNIDKAKAVREAKDRGATDAEIEQIKADYDKQISEAEERHMSVDNPVAKAEEEVKKREDEYGRVTEELLKTKLAKLIVGKESYREAMDITTGEITQIKMRNIRISRVVSNKLIIPASNIRYDICKNKIWYVVPMNTLFEDVAKEMKKGLNRMTAVETVVSRYAERFNDPDETANRRYKIDLDRIALTECENAKIDASYECESSKSQ